MSEEQGKVTGGCMCGAVRYEASGDPVSVIFCHCESCRRHTGAPVVALAGFKLEQVRFTLGERATYESTPGVQRGFCGRCGTPLTWEGDGTRLTFSFQHFCSYFRSGLNPLVSKPCI